MFEHKAPDRIPAPCTQASIEPVPGGFASRLAQDEYEVVERASQHRLRRKRVLLDDETKDPTGLPEAPDGDGENEVPDESRRKFLIRGISAIGGGIAAGIGVPAAVFVMGSASTATTGDEWIRLGSVASLEPGAPPTLMKAKIERRSGYLIEEQEVSVFVTTENGADFTVLSNVCSHLGCRVRWVEDQDGFFCPCHNAIFGRDGGVVQGPPPRPLDRFEAKVEDGQIFFKEA